MGGPNIGDIINFVLQIDSQEKLMEALRNFIFKALSQELVTEIEGSQKELFDFLELAKIIFGDVEETSNEIFTNQNLDKLRKVIILIVRIVVELKLISKEGFIIKMMKIQEDLKTGLEKINSDLQTLTDEKMISKYNNAKVRNEFIIKIFGDDFIEQLKKVVPDDTQI